MSQKQAKHTIKKKKRITNEKSAKFCFHEIRTIHTITYFRKKSETEIKAHI